MARYEFRPGDVAGEADFSDFEATIVGAQPVWSDDSDATYAEFPQGYQQNNQGMTARARAEFSGAQFADVATVAQSLIVRLKITTFNPATVNVVLFNEAATAVQAYVGLPVADGWIETPLLPQAADTDPNAIAYGTLSDLLSSDSVILRVANPTLAGGSNPIDYRVLEVVLVIITPDTIVHRTPWLRAIQRNDGLGASGTPRAVQTSTRANSNRGGPNAIW